MDLLEAIDHVEDLCTYLFTALERIAAPVEWSHVDVFKEAEALLVRDAASGQQMVLGGWLTQSSSVLSADFSSTRQSVFFLLIPLPQPSVFPLLCLLSLLPPPFPLPSSLPLLYLPSPSPSLLSLCLSLLFPLSSSPISAPSLGPSCMLSCSS